MAITIPEVKEKKKWKRIRSEREEEVKERKEYKVLEEYQMVEEKYKVMNIHTYSSFIFIFY